MAVAIKGFGIVLEGNLSCFKELTNNLLDSNRGLGAPEKLSILKHSLELSSK
jgi:hypothetical protein